jgi:hypothetical protein
MCDFGRTDPVCGFDAVTTQVRFRSAKLPWYVTQDADTNPPCPKSATQSPIGPGSVPLCSPLFRILFPILGPILAPDEPLNPLRSDPPHAQTTSFVEKNTLIHFRHSLGGDPRQSAGPFHLFFFFLLKLD